MKDLSENEKVVAQTFWRAIGTPFSNELLGALERGDWDYIAEAAVDPRAYTSAKEYFLDAASASLLRKYKGLPSNHDRVAKAIENWKKGESSCYSTNERLVPFLEGRTHPAYRGDVGLVIHQIREKIRCVLGRAPSLDDLWPRHGPGATYSDPSRRATIADKMSNRPSMTRAACWFLLHWVGTAWGRAAASNSAYPVEVKGNRFTTAPKDATKDRPIAMEPSINVFYQLAIGREVRHRLKRHGIDLDNGQDTHRQIACEASKTGSYATLDLKNASDTVAYNLVRLLLPHDWFSLFDELRSPFTWFRAPDMDRLVGRSCQKAGWVKLEKFSSMGNGFTFELETLLFWAITKVAVESAGPSQRVLVYGDDIICPTGSVQAVISALQFFGFQLNMEKSFWEGKFRESCGGDFWDGAPVRGAYLKEPLDEPHQLIAAANQVRRVAKDLFGGLGPLATTWFAIQDQLPTRVRRCRGPQSLGDVVIHDDEVNWSWTSSHRDRITCWRPVSYRKVPLNLFSDDVVFACGLYGERVSGGFLNPRDSVTGYAIRRVCPYGVSWLPSQQSNVWEHFPWRAIDLQLAAGGPPAVVLTASP